MGGMTSGEGFFRRTKMIFCRRTGGMSGKISKVWQKKARRWELRHVSNKP